MVLLEKNDHYQTFSINKKNWKKWPARQPAAGTGPGSRAGPGKKRFFFRFFSISGVWILVNMLCGLLQIDPNCSPSSPCNLPGMIFPPFLFRPPLESRGKEAPQRSRAPRPPVPRATLPGSVRSPSGVRQESKNETKVLNRA